MVQIKKKRSLKRTLAIALMTLMTTSTFYIPLSLISKENTLKALTAGESRTFNNTSTGATGANVNNSTGTLGTAPTFPGQTGIYHWTVPYTAIYEIEAVGANRSDGGAKGTRMKGKFTLTEGAIIKILVGQAGSNTSAGSGGTYVTDNSNNPLIVAGGAGYVSNAVLTNNGANVSVGYTVYNGYSSGGCGSTLVTTGGSNGSGGSYTNSGAGLTGNGASGALSFTNGGVGSGNGGFGGGGNASYGGGGGYSGGAGYAAINRCTEHHDGGGWVFDGWVYTINGGGGGGSYNAGSEPENIVRTDSTNNQGQVTIKMISPVVTQSPANGTKFQANYIDVSWTGSVNSDATITKYEIQAGTSLGGTNILSLTNKGLTTTQRLSVPNGTQGNTTIYWQVRATDSKGRVGPWIQSTVIYSNNMPKITGNGNTPVNLNVSLEKRQHSFSINSLIDSDDFNYVSLFADVLDKNGTVIPGTKKQIVLDADLMNNSAKLISGTGSEKDGSLQGAVNHTTPFNLKLHIEPDFTTGKFNLSLTKSDGVTNIIKSGANLLSNRSMQNKTDINPENFTLRIYPEDRQNGNTLATSPLSSVPEVTPFNIPFTLDTRNYLPRITNVENDVGDRIFSDNIGFDKISVSGHVDDLDPEDSVTIYYEVQPKAPNYSISLDNLNGKITPKNGIKVTTFEPQVNHDFSFLYQVDSALESGDYALLVYGYDSQEGLGDIREIPFTISREGPTIEFISDYQTNDKKTLIMSASEQQIVGEDSKLKLYFKANNYATFEYAGYVIRENEVKNLRIRGAFTNEIKTTFIGIDLSQDQITLLNGDKMDFYLGDIVIFKFKATSSTGFVTEKSIRILIGDDSSTFTPLDDINLPTIP